MEPMVVIAARAAEKLPRDALHQRRRSALRAGLVAVLVTGWTAHHADSEAAAAVRMDSSQSLASTAELSRPIGGKAAIKRRP